MLGYLKSGYQLAIVQITTRMAISWFGDSFR